MATIDDSLSKIRSVRNDIWRCRKLLQTELPDAEREMIEKRLLEQRSAFEGLLASTFPLALKLSSSSEETRLGLAVNFQEVVHSALVNADVAERTMDSREGMKGDGSHGTRELAGDTNRNHTSGSREIAGIDEPEGTDCPRGVMPAERTAEL
jgi:hypothetical protein